MTKTHSIFRAHTNIALIKYWGKRNEQLFLPQTNSLSLTLDAFYTDTKVSFHQGDKDCFILDGQIQDEKETAKLGRFLAFFKEMANDHRPLLVESINHVPTAAGLASSASAYAALASALNDFYNLNLSPQVLSTYARQGSGSACRSLFGGFVEWHQGEGDISTSSYAEQIDQADWDLAMLFIVLNDEKKKKSSREGMALTVTTSPFYALWPQEVAKDLQLAKIAIAKQDIESLGKVSEHNAMKMHASTLAANPSFTYWSPETLRAIQYVQHLRDDLGFRAYLTIDAGPNVKVLTPASEVEALKKQLLSLYDDDQLIIAKPGPAPYSLES